MRAAAVAKAAAAARTLQTTDGAVLESSNAGLVVNTFENIEQNGAACWQLLVSGAFREQPEDLGLLARWTRDITQGAFTGRVVPIDSEAAPLTALSTGQVSGADAFVVDASEAAADPSSVGRLLLTLNPPAQETATVFGASALATPVNQASQVGLGDRSLRSGAICSYTPATCSLHSRNDRITQYACWIIAGLQI